VWPASGVRTASLYAVDIGSGGLKSKFETKGWVVSSPAVASDVVYFLSYDSNFYAVDAGERTTEMEVPNRR